MICIRCKKHATFNKTVFQGTNPVKVTLCPDCTTSTNAEGLMANIKGAANRDAKHSAVEAFLNAVKD